MNILIIKTSSIGDVIQAFDALEYLKQKIDKCNIDWVVSSACYELISSHPLIRNAILFNFEKKASFFSKLKQLKKLRSTLKLNRYDAVFDLQGNCKSGLIMILSKSKNKVGFGLKTVSEWPNLISTSLRFDPPQNINIRQQYLYLIQKYFKDDDLYIAPKRLLKINADEEKKINFILNHSILINSKKILVSSSSKWKNKELNLEVLKDLLTKLSNSTKVSYLFLWGSEEERKKAFYLHSFFKHNSLVIERLSLSTLQNLIDKLDFVISMDSFALHLTGTTHTSSYSFFGPSNGDIYKPVGNNHLLFQSKCILKKKFSKRCSCLRSCSISCCMHDIDSTNFCLTVMKIMDYKE